MDVYVGAEHRHDDGIPLFRVFLEASGFARPRNAGPWSIQVGSGSSRSSRFTDANNNKVKHQKLKLTLNLHPKPLGNLNTETRLASPSCESVKPIQAQMEKRHKPGRRSSGTE